MAANRAKKTALMALEIDRDQPMANLAMAHVYTSYEWKWDRAEEAFNKTISLNPNAPEPRLFYADLLVSLHENERAMAQIEAALEVDPLNAFSHCLKGWVLMATGQFNQAIESMTTSIKSEANIPLSHRCLWTIYHLSEDYERAITHAIHFYRNQDLGDTADDLERVYNESGYTEAMKYAGEQLAEQSKIKFVHSMRVARLHTFCGDKKQALDWLEKAYEERYTSLFSLNVDPHWSSLYQEPRFLALLARMNLTLRK
jgi:Tfp pilus assembly protein PilF